MKSSSLTIILVVLISVFTTSCKKEDEEEVGKPGELQAFVTCTKLTLDIVNDYYDRILPLYSKNSKSILALTNKMSDIDKSQFIKSYQVITQGKFCKDMPQELSNVPQVLRNMQLKIKDREKLDQEQRGYITYCNKDYFKSCMESFTYAYKECGNLKDETLEWEECLNKKSPSSKRLVIKKIKHFEILDNVDIFSKLISKYKNR
jgi:hypothetical protein